MGRRLLLAVRKVFRRYPISRGMATYSVLWPGANMLQQSLDPHKTDIDTAQMFRFCILGTFMTAPTVYLWVRLVGKMVTGTTLRHAMLKAFYDITLFAPVGQTQFYFGVSLLEGKSLEECKQEVKNKLIPSWKVAACYWPFMQTLNFAYVPERNRVMMISLGSVIWTSFLSYMHHSGGQGLPAFFRPPALVGDAPSHGEAAEVPLENVKAKVEVLRGSGKPADVEDCAKA